MFGEALIDESREEPGVADRRGPFGYSQDAKSAAEKVGQEIDQDSSLVPVERVARKIMRAFWVTQASGYQGIGRDIKS